MNCSIAMLAGPDDAGHVRLLFNHAIRTSGISFRHRALTLDTLPSVRFPAGHASTARLQQTARDMLAAGEIDVIHETSGHHHEIERKHFGRRLQRPRDFRGIPLLGWALGIENTPTDYVCHFDCDILMHSVADYSWIANAIEVLQTRQDVLFVAPMGGPSRRASAPREQKAFSSRRFVVDRRRFAGMLPLPPTHRSWKRKLLMNLGGASSYWPWESHVRSAIERSPLTCLYLGDPSAWSIHCPDHGPLWKANLDALVRACEAGTYPPRQEGNVELELTAWLEQLANDGLPVHQEPKTDRASGDATAAPTAPF